MMNVRVPLPGSSTSVTHPVAMSVMSDIKAFLNVYTDVHVEIDLDGDNFKNKNWNLGDESNNDSNGPRDEVLIMGYKESYEDPHAITTKLRHNDTKSVVFDAVTKIDVKPLLMETKINISLVINNKSKSNLTSALNNLRLLFINNRDVSMHTIQYLYYMPIPYIGLLVEVMKIKNEVLFGNESLEEFLVPMVDDRFSISTDQSGKISSAALTFKEIQHNIIGYFTNDLLNMDIEYDENTGYYSTTIDYEFRFDKPISMDMRYPITVYNRLLPGKYIITAPRGSVEETGNFTHDQRIFNRFDLTNDVKSILDTFRYDENYIRIPSFDKHDDIPPRDTLIRIFSVLVFITGEDKRSLFNLNELGEFYLDPCVKAFLEGGEHAYIDKLFKSVFHMELYENGVLMTGDVLEIDSDLNVRTRMDLDITKTYRVFFNILPNLIMLDKDTVTRTKDNSNIINMIINVIKLIEYENCEDGDGVETCVDVSDMLNHSNVVMKNNQLPLINDKNIATTLFDTCKVGYDKLLLSHILALNIKTL